MIVRDKKKLKKALAIAGILALSITPTASFACDLSGVELNLSGANLTGANLGGANLSGAELRDATLNGANLSSADLSNASLSGVTATNLRGCPASLPFGWVCQGDSLIYQDPWGL